MALLTYLSFIFFSTFLHNPATAQRCPTSCPGSELELKFPFGWNLNGNQNGSCSYPGFGLSCSRTGEPTLKLAESGEFAVRYIDYQAQQIWIDDPDSCLPKRMLENFNLSGTPFGSEFWYTITFYNCSTSDVTQNGLMSIPCLSNSNYSVLSSTVVSTVDSVDGLPSTCQAIKVVTIPFVMDGIRLYWNEPNCRSCVERRGDCGFTDRNSLEIGCFNLPSQGGGGLPKGAKYGIIIGAGITGLLCLIGLVAFAGSRMRHRRHQRNLRNIEFSTSISPSVAIVISGLDGQTIESYPKTKLGDSGRLPKPNDNTCPICLSEYQPKETLRTIPECNHYFHADCIDEWLKMNGSCPLCRNSPDGSAPITPSISSSGSSSSSSLLSS